VIDGGKCHRGVERLIIDRKGAHTGSTRSVPVVKAIVRRRRSLTVQAAAGFVALGRGAEKYLAPVIQVVGADSRRPDDDAVAARQQMGYRTVCISSNVEHRTGNQES